MGYIIGLSILLFASIILNIWAIRRGVALVTQLENAQDKVDYANQYALDKLELMLEQMKQIDIRGSFESDDEVGSVFKELKSTIEYYKSTF